MHQVGRFLDRVVLRAVASGLGVGYAPVAPGTLGALIALPLWYWGGGWGPVHFGLLASLLVLSFPASRAEIRATGRGDPPSVVIDEVTGMLLAATGIPWGWKAGVVLFLLFRLFDIVKIGPVAWIDNRGGGAAVVADDLMAGLFANLACRGILWLSG